MGNLGTYWASVGVCGQLSESNGVLPLLAAMYRLMSGELDDGLIALAHGGAIVERYSRTRAAELGLADRVLRQLDREDSISTSASWAQWIENLFRWGLIGLRQVNSNA